jgi:hypothetical protein
VWCGYLLVWCGYFQVCTLFRTASVRSGAVLFRMLCGKRTHVLVRVRMHHLKDKALRFKNAWNYTPSLA